MMRKMRNAAQVQDRRLHGRLPDGFATCLALRISPGGVCVLANAGHLVPFLNSRELKLPPALPLGLTSESSFAQTTVGAVRSLAEATAEPAEILAGLNREALNRRTCNSGTTQWVPHIYLVLADVGMNSPGQA